MTAPSAYNIVLGDKRRQPLEVGGIELPVAIA